MDPVLADRLQFAFTVMFHYLAIPVLSLIALLALWWNARNGGASAAGKIRVE